MNEAFLVSILAVTIRAGTSLLYATVGEILTERSGILNLGVEGIMIMGAAMGFAGHPRRRVSTWMTCSISPARGTSTAAAN